MRASCGATSTRILPGWPASQLDQTVLQAGSVTTSGPRKAMEPTIFWARGESIRLQEVIAVTPECRRRLSRDSWKTLSSDAMMTLWSCTGLGWEGGATTWLVHGRVSQESSGMGRSNSKILPQLPPRKRLSYTWTWPPRRFIAFVQIASPRPSPEWFLWLEESTRQRWSNILDWSSLGMPMPVSVTWKTSTVCDSQLGSLLI
mmetsp:Transcript_202/g.680  ORF Transcript_202/g.680 Transcript_202/m.680 type:complete len:202 (-) Transcript_202:1391-1996(-)